jgi:hypothetical protein
MIWIANCLVALVAALHVYFLVLVQAAPAAIALVLPWLA